MSRLFTVHECEQQSPEWIALRLGKLTGSRAKDMLATVKTKGAEAAGRRNLRIQLVLERLTGRPQERAFQSQAMKDGNEREPDARGLYEVLTGVVVNQSGFLSHADLQAGCSLDGHVDDYEGIIEVKSPIPATHLDYLRSGIVPSDYLKQIIHNLWITGAQWCDWMSYQPDFPERLRSKIVRVERDEATIRDYDTQAKEFLAEVDRECVSLTFREQLEASAALVP